MIIFVVRASGIVINTCGWIEGLGYDLLLNCINSFTVDVVIVLGSSELYSSLIHDLDSSKCHIFTFPRSHAARRRSAHFRRESRMQRIRDYFLQNNDNGSQISNSGFPFCTVVMNIHDIIIYRIIGKMLCIIG